MQTVVFSFGQDGKVGRNICSRCFLQMVFHLLHHLRGAFNHQVHQGNLFTRSWECAETSKTLYIYQSAVLFIPGSCKCRVDAS